MEKRRKGLKGYPISTQKDSGKGEKKGVLNSGGDPWVEKSTEKNKKGK